MKNTTTIVKDSVCGMELETASAAGHTESKEQTQYFCGTKCKEKFDVNPDQYLASLPQGRRAAMAAEVKSNSVAASQSRANR